MTIGIVDCGIGNIRSVRRMFEAVDADAEIVTDPARCGDHDKLVLPGVGAFDAGMRLLEEGGWIAPLTRAVDGRTPLLGICLGMQLLCRRSEEGERPGLGWIEADVRLIDRGGDERLKLPHMGWAVTRPTRPNPLIADEGEQRFYFVHKYRVLCARDEDVLATADYGTRFTAAIQRDRLWGVQFHPEKSHRFGMAVMRGFADLPC